MADKNRAMEKRGYGSLPVWVRVVVFLVGMVVVMFLPAGRWDLPFVWGYVGVYALTVVAGWLTMEPELIREWIRPGPGDQDPLMRYLVLPFLVVHWLIASFDGGRYHWSDVVPTAVRVAGLLSMAVSQGLVMWTVSVNRFFSSAVRIQRERGHHLVTEGPYKYIRHPGYAATTCSLFLGALALGSLWAMAPLVGLTLIVLRRTSLEDRLLQKELEGYAEYAKKVPYRLIPGIW